METRLPPLSLAEWKPAKETLPTVPLPAPVIDHMLSAAGPKSV